MSEKKEYSRSIRMTNTVREYVESQPGDGFNEKFENMILFCMKHEKDIKKRIDEQQAMLNKQKAEIAEQRNILNKLENISFAVERALQYCETIVKL